MIFSPQIDGLDEEDDDDDEGADDADESADDDASFASLDELDGVSSSMPSSYSFANSFHRG